MNGLRDYCLRLIAGGFIVALLQTVLREGKVKRTVRLICGCFFAVLALQPLLSLIRISPEELLPELGAIAAYDRAAAEEKNRELLASLIETQTAERITKQAKDLGAELSVTVWSETDPELNVPVPVRVRLVGRCTPEQREKLTEQIASELNVPEEEQEWSVS